MIHTFCISHKKIQIPLSKDINIIWLGSDERYEENAENFYISKISDEFHAWHNFLGGSSGTFAIEKIISENEKYWNPEDKISIIQYRKFISKKPLGKPSKVYVGMQIISQLDALKINISDVQEPLESDFLLSQPINIKSTYTNYSSCHFPSDLLRYIAIAIDTNVISKSESVDFINFPLLIPGGSEFGIYPISVFMDITRKLKLVCLEYLKYHHPASLKGEQRRALAFCNERLGSYLLLKHLVAIYQDSLPANMFGYMHTISEEDYA